MQKGFGQLHLGDQGAVIPLIDSSPSHIWKPLLYKVAAGSLDSYAERLEYLAQGHWHEHADAGADPAALRLGREGG